MVLPVLAEVVVIGMVIVVSGNGVVVVAVIKMLILVIGLDKE